MRGAKPAPETERQMGTLCAERCHEPLTRRPPPRTTRRGAEDAPFLPTASNTEAYEMHPTVPLTPSAHATLGVIARHRWTPSVSTGGHLHR